MTSPEPECSWFEPPDTEADPARIRSEAAELRALSGVLTGHGSSVTAVLEQASLCFTDIVADSVLAQIGPDVAALEHAVQATEYGHAVGTTWADDVERYLNVRESLLAEWRHGLATNFGIVGIPPPGAAPDMAEAYEARRGPGAVQAARTELCGILTAQVMRAYDAFVSESIIRAAMFRDGATPANVAALGGALGFVAGTLWPDLTAVPIPLGADDGSADAQAALRSMDGLSSPEAVVEALERVTLLARRAESGQPLTPDEVSYLASFYEVLGDRVLEMPEYLDRSSYTYPGLIPTGEVDGSRVLYALTERTDGPLDAEGAAALTVAAANGLLVLSRTGPGGGGFARLPAWFRMAVQQSYPPSGALREQNYQLVETVDLLSHSTVEAGDGLSREMALAAERVLRNGSNELADATSTLSDEGLTNREVADSVGGTLLRVVGRNDQVSYELITGENMPVHYDRDEFFRVVYGFDWADDGAIAAGLTDFIRDWAADPDRSDDAHSATVELAYVVAAAEDFLLDGVGNSGDPASSALGQVNPAITSELGLTFASDPELFSAIEQDPNADIDSGTASSYATVVATGEEGRIALAAGLYSLERDQTAAFVADGGAADAGGPMGRLQRLVDDAITAAVLDADGDRVAAAEANARAREDAFSMIVSATAMIPGPAGKGAGFLAALADMVTRPDDPPPVLIDPDSVPGLRPQPVRAFAVAANIVNLLIGQGRIDPGSLPPGSLDENGLVFFPGIGSVEEATDVLVASAEAAGVDVYELIELTNDAYLGNG